jgi:hypothetical protein
LRHWDCAAHYLVLFCRSLGCCLLCCCLAGCCRGAGAEPLLRVAIVLLLPRLGQLSGVLRPAQVVQSISLRRATFLFPINTLRGPAFQLHAVVLRSSWDLARVLLYCGTLSGGPNACYLKSKQVELLLSNNQLLFQTKFAKFQCQGCCSPLFVHRV